MLYIFETQECSLRSFSHNWSIRRDETGNPSLRMIQETHPKGWIRKSIPTVRWIMAVLKSKLPLVIIREWSFYPLQGHFCADRCQFWWNPDRRGVYQRHYSKSSPLPLFHLTPDLTYWGTWSSYAMALVLYADLPLNIASRLPAGRRVDIAVDKALWNPSWGSRPHVKTFPTKLCDQSFCKVYENLGARESPRCAHKTQAEVLQEVDKGDIAV